MIRQVMFNPPSESPAIYWMAGHVTNEKFMSMMGVIKDAREIDEADIVRGYGTRKLDFIVLYLSDEPLPNYEPITYLIPVEQKVMA